jgi:DNA-directed RNA polymerase specialized sigma24 family protein
MTALRQQQSSEFTDFVRKVEARLKHALVALYGFDHGVEATAEALAYAWEHWNRVSAMDNPAGYLYRVGRSKTRRIRRPIPVLPPVPAPAMPTVEPGLPEAISRLSDRQRVAVMLVHAFGWTQAEAGQLMGIAATSVQKHLERGLAKLRTAIGGTT